MVASAPTIGPNDPLEWRRGMFFACIILSTWLFILELRLLIHMRLKYFLSFYKLLNGAAVVMPWIISCNGIVNDTRGPSRFTAFTILILWANFVSVITWHLVTDLFVIDYYRDSCISFYPHLSPFLAAATMSHLQNHRSFRECHHQRYMEFKVTFLSTLSL